MRRRCALPWLAVLIACAASAPPRAAADDAQVLLSCGGSFAYLYESKETALGFAAEALFRPGSVASLSERISGWDLSLALRYNRVPIDGLGTYEGAEVCLRKYLGRPERRGRFWVGVGGGRYLTRWDGGGESSKSSTVLEAGLEFRLNSRFAAQAQLVNRALEYRAQSMSGSAVILMIGTRINP